MSCRRRQKLANIAPEQKWDFISLNDFKSTSCFTPFAYIYLWFSLFISIAVYGVDTFTAVNLLAFNRWSGEIEPVIPLDVSKWIFSACIIASWINLGFEHLRAWFVMRRGAVAESYLDSLAVRLESVRMGKTGRGWRRFLVFAELTKSKQGVEYVALFTYFSFQSWIRIIFCQGPRQVINALTIYSVFTAKLDPSHSKDVGSAFVQFFKNVGILASQEHQQAVILSGMVFTLVVWIFGALSLLLAGIFYILFLWHHIPTADGGLTGYCERKINQRLKSIVSVRINKALEADERKRVKADAKAARNGETPVLGRQATLPMLFDSKDDDKLPYMPMLNRNDTTTTLPLYTSRPGTPSGSPTLPSFELGNLIEKRPFSPRTLTGSSTNSTAVLVNNASDMGYVRAASPAPSFRTFDNRPLAPRSLTSDTTYRGNSSDTVSSTSVQAYTPSPALISLPDVNGRLPRHIQNLRTTSPAGPPSSMGVARSNFTGQSSPAPSSGRIGPGPVHHSSSSPASYQGSTPTLRSASATPIGYPRLIPPGGYRTATNPMGFKEMRLPSPTSQRLGQSGNEQQDFPFPHMPQIPREVMGDK